MRWSEKDSTRTEPEPREPGTFASASRGVADTRVITKFRWHKYPAEPLAYIRERLRIELQHDPSVTAGGRRLRGHGSGSSAKVPEAV